jgi:hypothetical protein
MHLKICLAMTRDVIKSVLGFNLNYKIEGTTPGCRTVYPKEELTINQVKTNIIRNYKFFTNFDRQLLDKIIDYKRLNT